MWLGLIGLLVSLRVIHFSVFGMENVEVRIFHELLGATITFWMELAGGNVFQHFVIRIVRRLDFIVVFDFSSGNSTASFWLVLVGYAFHSTVHCEGVAGEFASAKAFSPHGLERDFAFLCEVFLPKFVY